jgi:3-phosphoshikimate 1-carboxyvinyltransferase
VNLLTIHKTNPSLAQEIHLPASKSISNRALIIQYLSGNKLRLYNLSRADDTQLMISLLKRIEEYKGSNVPIHINCDNAGTVTRFLTALLAITPGKWIITGSDRMKERPIGILAESLKKLGAKIDYPENKGFLPLRIEGTNVTGGELEIDSSISSQFISALLLIAPILRNGLYLRLNNKISSFPYVEMTLKLLNRFGIETSFTDNTIKVGQQEYRPGELTIEPDWTSACYWYELAALAPEVNLILPGLQKESLQGDSILPVLFTQFGVKTEFLPHGIRLTKAAKITSDFSFDFSNHPDLAQAVIVTCAGLNTPGNFTGLESLRIKETDRLSALQTELNKLGFHAEIIQNSGFRISRVPFQKKDPELQTSNFELIKTYGDHRMAMAFAPIAYVLGSIQIENPAVVSKSYPGYWQDLKRVGFTLTE